MSLLHTADLNVHFTISIYFILFYVCLGIDSHRFSSDASDLPLDMIRKCMGDPDADVRNPVLEMEQKLQVLFSFLNVWWLFSKKAT